MRTQCQGGLMYKMKDCVQLCFRWNSKHSRVFLFPCLNVMYCKSCYQTRSGFNCHLSLLLFKKNKAFDYQMVPIHFPYKNHLAKYAAIHLFWSFRYMGQFLCMQRMLNKYCEFSCRILRALKCPFIQLLKLFLLYSTYFAHSSFSTRILQLLSTFYSHPYSAE